MINKYIKKPIEIEAIQYTGENWTEVMMFIDIECTYHNATRTKFITIDTPEGRMIADAGDYIIKGIKGEFYPCKPDIFKATYNKIN